MVEWRKDQHFKDHLCPCPQGADMDMDRLCPQPYPYQHTEEEEEEEEEEDRDCLQNVGFFTVQSLDPADSPRELYYTHKELWINSNTDVEWYNLCPQVYKDIFHNTRKTGEPG
jgi:hypothetical protein